MFTMIVSPTAGSLPPVPHKPFPLAAKVRRCLALIEMSEKEAAYVMEVDASDLSKQLAEKPGHHLSFGRLLKLPAEFWCYFIPELAAHYGMRVEDADALGQLMAEQADLNARFLRLANFPKQQAEQPQLQRRA